MSNARQCPQCGIELPVERSHCRACESKWGTVVKSTSASCKIRGNSANVINDGIDPETDEYYILQGSPDAESEARTSRSRDASVSVEVYVRDDGRDEKKVLKILRQALRERGHEDVSIRAGQDDRGEDGIICVGREEFVVQITKAQPGERRFWQHAHEEDGAIWTGDSSDLAQWLDNAIEKKAELYGRGDVLHGMVLAIDVQHPGLPATMDVIDRYLAHFGDPVQKHGFASIWVVGPTVKLCAPLGGGAL